MLKYISRLEDTAKKLATGDCAYRELKEIHANLRMTKSSNHYLFGIIDSHKPMLIIAILHERMQLIQKLKNRLAY